MSFLSDIAGRAARGRTGRAILFGLVALMLLAGALAPAGGAAAATAQPQPGGVVAWGDNRSSQLGFAFKNTQRAAPGPVAAATDYNIVDIAGGRYYSIALRADGRVLTWGSNFTNGQLGLGSTVERADPTVVPGIPDARMIAADNSHGLAANGGTVYAWGNNVFGLLGYAASEICGGFSCSRSAQPIPSLGNVKGLGAGLSHSLAVLADGTVRAWGQNNTEQIGVTQPASVATPTAVPGLLRAYKVAGGGGHSLALTLPGFCDVNGTTPYAAAIAQLAARGVIRGYQNGCFGPGDTTQRAQMAAFIARAMGWDAEDRGNPFADRNGIDADLWRNVGTLAYYGVAYGYSPTTFGPNDQVTMAQTISFITRAMVVKGYWQRQPDNPALYSNLPASSGHRGDLATYLHYVAGPLPGTASTTQAWGDWAQPATRGWFSESLWRALNTR